VRANKMFVKLITERHVD